MPTWVNSLKSCNGNIFEQLVNSWSTPVRVTTCSIFFLPYSPGGEGPNPDTISVIPRGCIEILQALNYIPEPQR